MILGLIPRMRVDGELPSRFQWMNIIESQQLDCFGMTVQRSLRRGYRADIVCSSITHCRQACC